MYKFNKSELSNFDKISKMEFYMPNELNNYYAS